MQKVALWVGIFLTAGIVALLVLAFKFSNFSSYTSTSGYQLSVAFDNIGELKLQSPVTIAGVRVGRITAIKLDDTDFRAHVTLRIEATHNHLPTDTSAIILTQGLLGTSYIALKPGFASTVLKNGDVIGASRSALILEDLLPQLLFGLKHLGEKR